MAYIVPHVPRFQWDPEKDEANRQKHGLSFQEVTGLWGADHLEIYDEAHSDDEERFIGVGLVERGVVVVVFTEPEDDLVRVVSARMATKLERERYQAWAREHHE